MRLCRGLLLLQASGLLVACGSTFGLLLGLACAPGRSKRLIIMTGGTSLRYCQKAETLETVSNSERLHYTLLTYPVDRFLFFHPASISLLPLFNLDLPLLPKDCC